MMLMFPVVSRVSPTVPLTFIPVEAPGKRLGKKLARHIARKLRGIPKPVVLDERTTALEIRRMADAMRPRMPDLNHSVPFWRQNDRVPLYDGK